MDEGQKVTTGQILAWMSSTERAALVDAARAQGPQELKKWEDAYQMTPILSPVNGLIILKNFVPGQTVTTADIVLSMSDDLMIKAVVDETDLAQISSHQKSIVTLDAYPNDPIDSYVSKISYDAKTVNNVTTYEVDVLPKKPPPFMRSGMTANIEFVLKQTKKTLLIPTSSIHKEGGSLFVMVTDPRSNNYQKAKKRIVTVGNSDGKKTEVLAGVTEGESVLIPDMSSINQLKKESEESNTFGRPKRSGSKPNKDHS